MTRQLSEILTSGEITAINKGGVAATDTVLDQGETETLIDDKLADGSVTSINIGGTDPGDAVLTQDLVDQRVVAVAADGSLTSVFIGSTDPDDEVLTHAEVDALIQLAFTSAWRGEFDPTITYVEGDLVRDSNWVMVATAETRDRAAPLPTGVVTFKYTNTSGLSVQTPTASYVLNGIRFSPDANCLVTGYRIYIVEGYHYQVFVSRDFSTTPSLRQVAMFVASETGWVLFDRPPMIVRVGDEVDILVRVTEANPTESIGTANYNYVWTDDDYTVTPPTAGEMRHLSNPANTVYINNIDADAIDQTGVGGVLENIAVGSKIRMGTMEWTVQEVTDRTTFLDLRVMPCVRLTAEGIMNFTFADITAAGLVYHSETNAWLSDSTMSGLLAIDSPACDIVADDNGYGVDICYQQAYLSPDWNVVLNNHVIPNLSAVGLTGQEKHLDAENWLVYTSLTVIGPNLSEAEITALVGSPPPLYKEFYIQDPTYLFSVTYTATGYVYHQLSSAV